jgi:hypothetical protein
LGDLDIYGEIILKWTLSKWDVNEMKLAQNIIQWQVLVNTLTGQFRSE